MSNLIVKIVNTGKGNSKTRIYSAHMVTIEYEPTPRIAIHNDEHSPVPYTLLERGDTAYVENTKGKTVATVSYQACEALNADRVHNSIGRKPYNILKCSTSESRESDESL